MILAISDAWRRLVRRRHSPSITFGVGAAKTGTSSLAAVLKAAGIAAAHEPDCEDLIKLILARQAGDLPDAKFRSALSSMIDAQALEANISQINGFVIDDLIAIYPRAKYILTVRDAETWVLSFLNHATTRSLASNNIWHQFRALRFDRNLSYCAGDEALRPLGLQSLDSYLTFWLENTLNILRRVPHRQLLLLSTANIDKDLGKVARFIGFAGALSIENAHENRGSYSRALPIDASYLRNRCVAFTNLLLDGARELLPAERWQILSEMVQPPEPSYYARPVDQRIARTADLKANRTTDVQRWENVHLESDERWDGRARLAATMILDQPSVVDLGCGSMLIERYVKKGVRYVPVDVVRRDSRTIVWDVNAHSARLPSEVEGPCVVALGLLEYVHDVPAVLASLARGFKCVVCSYIPTDISPSIEQRRSTGWVNDLSVAEIEHFFTVAGFAIERREVYLGKTHLWRLGRLPADTLAHQPRTDG